MLADYKRIQYIHIINIIAIGGEKMIFSKAKEIKYQQKLEWLSGMPSWQLWLIRHIDKDAMRILKSRPSKWELFNENEKN